MKLSQKDYYEYLNTHLNLLFFVGYYTGILDEETEFEDFLKNVYNPCLFSFHNVTKSHCVTFYFFDIINYIIKFRRFLFEEKLGFRRINRVFYIYAK